MPNNDLATSCAVGVDGGVEPHPTGRRAGRAFGGVALVVVASGWGWGVGRGLPRRFWAGESGQAPTYGLTARSCCYFPCLTADVLLPVVGRGTTYCLLEQDRETKDCDNG